MEMVNVMQNIILDVNKAEEQVRIQVRNKDALSRVWRFWLVDDGKPVDLSPYYLATFEMQKGKNTAVSNACGINPKEGYIDYTVTEGTVRDEGSFSASLVLYGGGVADGSAYSRTLGTPTFTVTVYNNSFGEDLDQGQSDFNSAEEAAGVATGAAKDAQDASAVAGNAAVAAKESEDKAKESELNANSHKESTLLYAAEAGGFSAAAEAAKEAAVAARDEALEYKAEAEFRANEAFTHSMTSERAASAAEQSAMAAEQSKISAEAASAAAIEAAQQTVTTDKIADGAVTEDKLSEDVKRAISDAMYEIPTVKFLESGGELKDGLVNGINIYVSGNHIGVGTTGGVPAGWSSSTLVIPAYVRDQYGVVRKVTTINDSALLNYSLTNSTEYKEARVYIPNTITKFGANCFEQHYGEAGGHLYIVADGVTPSGYDPDTTTVYNLRNPFLVVDFHEKIEDINTILQHVDITSWKDIQDIVRAGLASKVFNIGDQLTCQRGNAELVWDIIGIDHDTPTDKTKKHSLTLQLHDCFTGIQFDGKEALYYAESELAAGTYNFHVVSNPWYAGDAEKTFQFTLANAVPAGGQIAIDSAYNASIAGRSVMTYASNASSDVIETATISEGSGGTALGTADGSVANLNHIQRVIMGSNNWTQSAVRQYLNSSAEAGGVWAPKTNFDRPPVWATNTAGFLNGFDEDFLAVIGDVDKITVLNSITDGDGKKTSTERFFLLSRSEVFSVGENGVSEGVPYPYYKNNSDFDSPNNTNDTNRIKYRDGTSRPWWLRSPSYTTSGSVRYVNATGSINQINSSTGHDVVPACCIV